MLLGFAPLAVMTGCSLGDIQLSNAVGEKILIKRSTINARKWGLAEAQKIIDSKEKTNFKKWALINYQNCIDGPVPRSPAECKKDWQWRDYEKTSKEIADLQEFSKQGLEIRYATFTPIVIDLNGFRRPLPQSRLICGVSERNPESIQLASQVASMAGISTSLSEPSGIDMQRLAKEVCSASGSPIDGSR